MGKMTVVLFSQCFLLVTIPLNGLCLGGQYWTQEVEGWIVPQTSVEYSLRLAPLV